MQKVAPPSPAEGLPTEPALRKIRIPCIQRATVGDRRRARRAVRDRPRAARRLHRAVAAARAPVEEIEALVRPARQRDPDPRPLPRGLGGGLRAASRRARAPCPRGSAWSSWRCRTATVSACASISSSTCGGTRASGGSCAIPRRRRRRHEDDRRTGVRARDLPRARRPVGAGRGALHDGSPGGRGLGARRHAPRGHPLRARRDGARGRPPARPRSHARRRGDDARTSSSRSPGRLARGRAAEDETGGLPPPARWSRGSGWSGMVSQRDLLQIDLSEKDEEIRWLNAYIHFIPPVREGTS